MKKTHKILVFLVIMSAILITLGCSIYVYNLSPVNDDDTIIAFEVESGDTFLTIASTLKEGNFIRSEFFYKLYVKLYRVSGLEAGTYYVSSDMGVKELVTTLSGKSTNANVMNITFKEGLHMRKIAKTIADSTEYTEEEVLAVGADTEFLNELISEYWFLTDDILNEEIYYPLEGYLFPDTYQFVKDASIEDIFRRLLDRMDAVLTPYKEEIEKSEYSIHEILTLASIVELEAAGSDDRAGVAGVFYNRLENNWSLGSDVTTYYAIKIDMNERDLYKSELDDYNAYNTRSSKMAGKLPVGPICNPGLDALVAAIEPTEHNYFYFVADKNKKTYFTKTSSEHTQKISELKSAGLWYEY